MYVSYLIRTLEPVEVVEELCRELPAQRPDVRHAVVRLQVGATRVVEMRVQPAAAFASEMSWGPLMAATEELYDEIETAVPVLRTAQGELYGDWWPVVVAPDLEVDGTPRVVEASTRGRFGVGWDGAWLRADDAEVEDRLLDLGAQALAQFTETRLAMVEARAVLASPGDPAAMDDHLDQIHAARRRLVDAVVTLDPRAALSYEYEVEFIRAVRDAWFLGDQVELAERSLTAVQDLLHLDASRAAQETRHRQAEQARMVATWLFVVSVASGISVIFGGIDFVSTPSRPEVGDAIRFLVFAACVIVTLVAAGYFRRTQAVTDGPQL